MFTKKKNDKELKILQKLEEHENIVKVIAYDNKNIYFKEYKSDLLTLIKNEELTDDMRKQIAIDIANAVEYCHSKGVIHCDIKPENILITHDNHAVLCDFDLSLEIDEEIPTCGSPMFMSPELFLLNSKNKRGPEIDNFAYGCLLRCLWCNECVYTGSRKPRIINQLAWMVVKGYRLTLNNVPEFYANIMERRTK